MNRSRRTSAKIEYYRDLFLVWPLLFSSLATGGLLFSQNADDRSKGVKCAVLALLILVAARRRLALVFGVIAFLASQLVVSVNRPSDWRINIVSYAVGISLLWVLGRLHESRSLRRLLRDDLHEFASDETTMADLLVNLSGLIGIFAVFFVLFR
jgi:hypothetical protein